MTKHIPEDDFLKVAGELKIELRDLDGKLLELREVPNLVVTVGKNTIADRMKQTPAMGHMTHMAVGTTSTAAAAGDTTLGAEVAGSRVALTSTTVTNNQIVYVATFPAGTGTGALVEAGLFSASSGGNMLARTTFSTINKAAGDSLTITWTVTIS